MKRLSRLAALAAAALMLCGPALAWDPAKAGRYGGLDLDKLDVGGQVLLRGRSMVGNGCASTDGGYAIDGTQSWQPTCFGTFLSPNQNVRVFPTRGTPKGADGNPVDTFKAVTGNLIQFQADGAIKRESNGQFINMDSVGGSVSAAELDTTNAVGQLISIRQRPGPNGEKPPTTWGHNIDFHIAPGAGATQSWGVEYDMNNFNQSCFPGSPCLSSAMFFNGIGGWTNTAWLYSGGGTTQFRNSTANISGRTLTRTGGDVFLQDVYRIRIGGTFYHAHYVSADRVDADVDVPQGAQSVQWQNAMVNNGVLFQGENMAAGADLALNTSAFRAVQLGGNHLIGIDTTGDSTKFALTAGLNQKVCLNGLDGCLYYAGTNTLRYEQNGGRPLTILGNPGGVNGINIASAGTGFGAVIQPDGPDTNIPLNLQGKGISPVQITGGMTISGSLGVNGLPTSAGAVRGTVCIDTSGNLYIKTTTGACL